MSVIEFLKAIKGKYSDDYKKGLRDRLRIMHDRSDDEIFDLLEAALLELHLAGVPLSVLVGFDVDPLIKQAVVVYLKAEFGFDAPDADAYRAAFEKLKVKMTLSSAYLGAGGGEV